MAQFDLVVLNNGGAFQGELDSKGHRPLIGVVETEGGGVSVVVWENGKKVSVPDVLLQKVFGQREDAPDGKAVGKWIQMVDYPLPGVLPESTPKSPAASGLCVQAYGLGNLGEVDPDVLVAILAIEDGRSFVRVLWPPGPGEIDDSGANREDQGRRTVLHDG